MNQFSSLVQYIRKSVNDLKLDVSRIEVNEKKGKGIEVALVLGGKEGRKSIIISDDVKSFIDKFIKSI